MSLNIKEITETLEFNKEDLKDNRMLTNEILVDDIMLELGYNKRRDKSVQRLYDKLIDWIVSTNSGKKLAIKVLAYNESTETAEDMQDTLKYCADARFSLLIVITGKAIQVLRYDKVKLLYNEVKTVSLESELSDTDSKIIESISKDTFDLDFIDSLLKAEFGLDDVARAVSNNTDILEESVITIIHREAQDVNNASELAKEFISRTLLSNTQAEETGNSIDDKQLQDIKDTYQQEINSLNNKVEALESQVVAYKDQHEQDQETIEQLKIELSDSPAIDNSQVDKLKEELEATQSELDSKNTEISELEAKLDSQVHKVKELEEQIQSNKFNNESTQVDSDVQHKLDAYVSKIREQSVQISELEEERDNALERVKEMQKEVDELSGSDLRFAEQLLASIEDDEEDDRSYVAVINKELLNYEDIHTFIGRCLQKLYDLKAFDASQFIFNGDIFKMDINSRFSDIVMNNKTYDVTLSTDNENEELNKLRVVFSHFDDVVFVCKKIGTLRKNINSRYDIPEEREEIQLESDEYLQDTFEEDTETQQETTYNEEQTYDESYSEEQTYAESYDEEQYSETNENIQFDDEQMPFDDEEQMPFDDEQEQFNDGTEQTFEDSSFDNTQFNGEVPYFDDGLAEELGEQTLEKHLLVGQLLNIDMLIWSEEPIKFNNIKYISTNIITFGINTTDDSYDKLLCKCIDAVLAIEAFNGSKDLVNKLKQKDFSSANNFLKLYSPEYAQYPRINGTKYVVAGLESVQQVAAALLDVCNIMDIDTQEIFLYFEAETNSQYIIEQYEFSEDAIRISETTSYIPEEGTVPNQAIAIIKGDMFNHIVITKNSLKVHKEVFNKALAIKTKYLGVVLDSIDKVCEVMGDMITTARNSGITVDYKAIGNVIGENYMLISEDESRVSENHVELVLASGNVFVSRVEDWQVPHSLIKVHTTLFNNTAIAVKSNVNADAINYYRTKFETSEPSLGLAVNSFADYVASCVKE